MLDDHGIYREPSKKKLLVNRINGKSKITAKGKIAKWGPSKRAAFERQILARTKSLATIAKEYDLSTNAVMHYKQRILMPALAAAEQQRDVEQQSQARQHLSWLYQETKDSIEKVKYGEVVLDPETGMPRINPETGEEMRVFADSKVHGTVAQLINAGRAVVEKIGEATGEFRQGNGAGDTPTIVKIITIPKIGESIDVAMPSPAALPPATDFDDEEDDVA